MALPGYLVLDVDDTLTVGGGLQPEVLAALVRARDAGIEVILNTGRSAGWGAALLSYLKGVSAVIVENGGAWFDGHGVAGSGHVEVPVQLLHGDPGAGADTGLRARLVALRLAVAGRLGLHLTPTADDPFRLTDHTVVRTLPAGAAGAAVLARMHQAVAEETGGAGGLLASSIHVHFFIDGPVRRSKAAGAAALLERRGVQDPHGVLARTAVAIGDSANDASLFHPGRFALSCGVRNIERYLPELGDLAPRHITAAREGWGVIEVIADLLSGRLSIQ